MNGSVAKFLRRLASLSTSRSRPLKRLWKRTPSNKRNALRRPLFNAAMKVKYRKEEEAREKAWNEGPKLIVPASPQQIAAVQASHG